MTYSFQTSATLAHCAWQRALIGMDHSNSAHQGERGRQLKMPPLVKSSSGRSYWSNYLFIWLWDARLLTLSKVSGVVQNSQLTSSKRKIQLTLCSLSPKVHYEESKLQIVSVSIITSLPLSVSLALSPLCPFAHPNAHVLPFFQYV